MKAKEALFRQLIADGVKYLFGNPGTTEESLMDIVHEFPEITYVVCTHETTAVAMADAYARATQKPAYVHLHCSAGSGNAISMIYQANRGHGPLVILAGEGPLSVANMDPLLAADLQDMTYSTTKWTAQVKVGAEVPRMLRRAAKIAGTQPWGPVYLSLPMDALDEELDADVEIRPTTQISTRVAPTPEFIKEAATTLAGAKNPIFIIGDGVAFSGAKDEAEKFAEILGCPVYGSEFAEVNFSMQHPLFQELFGHTRGEDSSPITKEADVVFICGTYVFNEVFPFQEGVFAPGAKIIHVDLNPWYIGLNFVADIASLGDPKISLSLLTEELAKVMTDDDRVRAKDRFYKYAKKSAEAHAKAVASDEATINNKPIMVARLMRELSKFIDEDTLFFDEGITSSRYITRYNRPTKAGTFFQIRGGSLGVGVPGAFGLKLAHPDKRVVGIVGDGSTLFGIHTLWTAAKYNIPAVIVVCNNHSYKILKYNLSLYRGESPKNHKPYPKEFDLTGPTVDYAALARSMGCAGFSVQDPSEIGDTLAEAFKCGKPAVVDVSLDMSV